MGTVYRVRYRKADFEIEIESSDKAFVDSKLSEFVRRETPPSGKQTRGRGANRERDRGKKGDESSVSNSTVNIPDIVDSIKNSEDHSLLDSNVLKKPSQLPRILMCLYYVKDNEDPYLTTGQIETITDQLGVKIKSQNAANTIKRNLSYFSADRVRKTGAIVRYKLNRKGIEEFKKILKKQE